MSLAYMLLPVRRLWWFFTDWKTYLTFSGHCGHCDNEVKIEGKGFGIHWLKILGRHNPYCKFRRYFEPVPCRKAWRCRYCLTVARVYIVRFIKWRWEFRNKYNWGILK